MWFLYPFTVLAEKYQPIWVSVLVLDLNQNSGFGHTLKQVGRSSTCMSDESNGDIPPMEMSFMDNPFPCLLALASFVCFILELALLCFSQLCCSGFAD